METRKIGTVEIPTELREFFFVVPRRYFWALIPWISITLLCVIMWDVSHDHVLSTYTKWGNERWTPFWIAVLGIAVPFWIWRILYREAMRHKAKQVADLITDTLDLDADFHRAISNRFMWPWNTGLAHVVPTKSRRFRVLGPLENMHNRHAMREISDQLHEAKSKQSWIATVKSDLSYITIDLAPPGYDMPGDEVIEQSDGWNYMMDQRIKEMREAQAKKRGKQ